MNLRNRYDSFFLYFQFRFFEPATKVVKIQRQLFNGSNGFSKQLQGDFQREAFDAVKALRNAMANSTPNFAQELKKQQGKSDFF